MALTADLNYTMVGETARRLVNKGTAADVLYKGALLNYDANGLLVVASDTANHKFAGICVKQVTLAGVATDVEIERGVIRVPYASAAQTDLGKAVYATADDTIALTATNTNIMGVVEGVEVGVAVYVNTERGVA
jgi:hypothetical protein